MHAFDLNKVAGRTIDVRRAHEGEKIVTLDEMCIRDRAQPVPLGCGGRKCGRMPGKKQPVIRFICAGQLR